MNGRMDGRSVWVVGACAMLVVGAMVVAGPITPPSGAIAPTGKTLQEIFDKPSGDGRIAIAGGTVGVTITQPGSYVLTGNITVSTGVNAISIAAGNVTLDLNGFRLSNTNTTGAVVSITGTGTFQGITIRNGLISGGNAGVSQSSAGGTTSGLLLEDLNISDPKNSGISISSSITRGCVVRRCRVYDTGSTTIASDGSLTILGINVAGTGSRIEDCLISRMIYNGSGTGSFRAIQVSGALGVVDRCVMVTTTPVLISSIGLNVASGSCVYRGNTVFNFTDAYFSGTDGGGNF